MMGKVLKNLKFHPKKICRIQVGVAHFESNATYRYIFNMHLESDGPKELEGAFTSQSVS